MAATGFAVDLDSMFRASAQFLDTKNFVYDIAAGAVHDLAPSQGMAGNDSVAQTFASQYEPAARAVIQAIGKGGEGLAAISSRLLTMSWNYLRNEDSIASEFVGGVVDTTSGLAQPQAQCETSTAYVALPQVIGATEQTRIPVIGQFWPQGDPVKLRASAAVWMKAAQLVDTAQVNSRNQAAPLLQTSSGDAINGFTGYLDQVVAQQPSGSTTVDQNRPLLENASAGCRLLATACTSYADAITKQRNTLRNLAIAAGVITAAGVVLTIVTIGLSDEGAAVADAALAADAASAATAFAAAEAGSTATAAIAQAEVIILAEAQALNVSVAQVAAATTLSAITITAAAAAPLGPTGVGVGPIPPRVPPAYPLYSPAKATAATAWLATLPTRGANYGTAQDRAYQARIAGPVEYAMTGADGRTVWADGFRPADGAIVDAKNVREPDCSPRTLDGLQQGDFATQLLSPGDGRELSRYAGAVNNPSNQAQFLEIDTNDAETVPYWQFLAAQNHVKSDVRYVP
jgi:hypothetical protein